MRIRGSEGRKESTYTLLQQYCYCQYLSSTKLLKRSLERREREGKIGMEARRETGGMERKWGEDGVRRGEEY